VRRHPLRFDWMNEARDEGPAPVRRVRLAIAAGCFVVVSALFVFMDFGDRGRHFDPDRTFASNVLPGSDGDLARLRVLTRCIGFVRTNYVDPARADASGMLISALEQVERKVPEFISEPIRDVGGRATAVRVRVGDDERRFDITRVTDLYTLSWKMLDIFGFVAPSLAGSTIDAKTVEYAAINGMLRTLDPHSVLLTPSVYQDMKMGTTGQFGGLGIVLGSKDGRLVIESVMEGTPASKAGLESRDLIVQIEGESTMNMSLSDAVDRLRGEPGTAVVLWIDRKGFTQPRKYRIVRENITLASVTSQRLEGGVGYARIKNFQQSTSEDLKSAVERMSAEVLAESGKGLAGLVVDLRDNPGGLLDQAIEVSDLLLSDGVIVTTVGSGNRVREERIATRGGTYTDLPVAVLLNGGSASASEIVAGALRNNDRAIVIGQRSFGKGSVQVLYDIDDVALKLTIAQYLTPGDESIQSVGIAPHIELVPVSVSRDWVQLNASERDGERTLENHLENGARVKHHESDARVHFLVSEDDFTVEFARRVLAEDGRNSARAMVKGAHELLTRVDKEQETKIVEALGRLDVDWTTTSPVARPKLDTKLALVSDGRTKAGDTISVVLSVTNSGNAAVSRIRGLTESPLEPFAGIELPIGRIPPGETRRWSAKIVLPIETLTEMVPVRVRLWSDMAPIGEGEPEDGVRSDAALPAVAAEAWLTAQGLARPRFAYSVVVDDRDGNGDGLLNENESADLVVRVDNVGRGAAKKTLATLKNRGGEEVFITDGRTWLDGIAPGGHAMARFHIEVKRGVPTAGLQLDLQVTDTELEERLTHTLPLPFSPTAGEAFVKSPGRFAVGAAEIPVFGAASDTATVLTTVAPGVAFVSDGHAGDFVRVTIDGGLRGWARREGLVAPTGATIAALPKPPAMIRPPSVEFFEPLPLETRSAELVLAGRATFPSIDLGERPDLYVFRDEEKVYFERTGETQRGYLDFRSVIPLHPGLNEIAVYARSGRDLGAKTRLFVYKK
jgi:carboxyl-terminal processing protease